ncbi:MAG: hypothetical protein E7367_00045 [Clostridiales bacterium]|nr:hypothetical protein [Clostridiales bacterium]
MKDNTQDTAKNNGKNTKKAKKEKIVYIDDHHTVANMNVEGMPWHTKSDPDPKKQPDRLSFKEKLALTLGAYRAYLPIVLGIGFSLLFVYLLLKLMWS